MRRSLRQPSPGLAPAQQQLAYARRNPQGGDPTQRSVRCDATPSCSHEVLVVGCHRGRYRIPYVRSCAPHGLRSCHTRTRSHGTPSRCGHSRLTPCPRPAPVLAQLAPEVADRPLELLVEGPQIGRYAVSRPVLERFRRARGQRSSKAVVDSSPRSRRRARPPDAQSRASSSMVAPSWSTRLTVTDACCRVSK
jgi:hypothetical protein